MPAPDPPGILLASGVLSAAMPLAVWSLLYRRHPSPNLELWCVSGLLFSAALALASLRDGVAHWASQAPVHALGYLAALLMIAVLRLEGGRRPPWPALAAVLAVMVGLQLAGQGLDPLPRTAFTLLSYALLAASVSAAAVQLARRRNSRSARMMAWLFAAFGLAAALRCLRLLVDGSDTQHLPPEVLLMVAAGVLSLVFANIGFMGLALERATNRVGEQRQLMDELRDTQQAMQAAARTREAVAGERARTTRLLAHEVRQPLHNAAVALQSGVATLAHSRDPAEAAHAIEQAQEVIRRVSTTLDNTVAATTMLAAQDRISTADTDLNMLIELCLGDLPAPSRARVRVDYRADARSARLEPSLLRLALRNLLMNATLYAPPDTPVTLRVLDSDEPLALVLDVVDQGPGIEEGLREHLFDEGARGTQPTVPGYGLGLHVVKRVARLHGGSVEWMPNEPRGSVFRLVLPQGDPR